MQLYALCLLAGLDHRSWNQGLVQAPPSPHSADTTKQHKLSSGEAATLWSCQQPHKPRAFCRKPKLGTRLCKEPQTKEGFHKRRAHSKAKLPTALQSSAGSHCCLCRDTHLGLAWRTWGHHTQQGGDAPALGSAPVLGQFGAPQHEM